MRDMGGTGRSGKSARSASSSPDHTTQPTAVQAQLVQTMSEDPPEPDLAPVALDAGRYTSEERYGAEDRHILSAFPRVICPSAALPEPNSAIAIDDFGTPLVLTRDAGGRAHAFVNACSHRGTRLIAQAGSRKGKLIACPYHAWCYDMEGKLRSVTEPNAFPGLDKKDFALTEMPSYEAGGIIWFAAGSLERDHLVDLEPDLEAFGLSQSHVFRQRRHVLGANWKLVMDAFLEGYHAPVLHSASIARFFPSKAESFDRTLRYHIRRANARKPMDADPEKTSLDDLKQAATFTYILFPNAILIVSPDYANLLVLAPQSAGSTIIEDYMLVSRLPETAEQERRLEKSWELVDFQTFANEDFKVAEWAQQGLETGAVDRITIGHREYLIGLFHQTLDEILRA